MSLEYAQRRIKEALRLSGGNTTRARQQVIAWTYEDSKLLHALTKHHLTGIVAYHIERVNAGRGEEHPVAEAPKAAKTAAKSSKPDNSAEDFGMEILKAAGGGHAAIFGLEGPSVSRRAGQVSDKHIEAIRRIASKSEGSAADKNSKKKK